MKCRRCGRNNPPNAQRCMYCGASLAEFKKNNQKQTESVIVALVILLVALLTMIAGVMIYNVNRSRRTNHSSGGGGGTTSSPIVSTDTPSPTVEPTDSEIADEPVKETVSPKPPKPTESPEASDGKLAKKNAFLETAAGIDLYTEQHLDTAGPQSEINFESEIVFEKWDVLLNEVYQYLKTIMSERDFLQLQNEELAWINEKETAIEEAGAEWQGGSGEPMVRNLTAIRYTKDRCYYLISLID